MKYILFLIILYGSLSAQNNFSDYFEDKTLRFDYYHVGNDSNQSIVFEEMIEEPFWGGRKYNLIDTLNLGNYFFTVSDIKSNEKLYSHGFCTLFGEWRTTDEAKKYSKTFDGSVVFPFPKATARLDIYSRNRENIFENIYSHSIDPSDYFIKRKSTNFFDVDTIYYSGIPADKYDIVLIPEGYTKTAMSDFINHCKILTNYLFETTPFKEMKNNFNIWAVKAESVDSLCDIPAEDKWYNTLLDASYYTFNTERYIMTANFQKVRDVASNAPYDQIYILANSEKYGGGAIYNHYSLTVTKNPRFKDIFIHELGHGIAGLADEYGYDTTYNDFYKPDVEPWEKNITTLVDFDSKWKHLIDKDIPIPTPNDSIYFDKLGVFEGAGYVGRGVYRSTYDSIMRSLGVKSFNIVSQNAIKDVVLLYSK